MCSLFAPLFASDMNQQLPANLVGVMEQRMKLIEQRSAYLQEQINQVIFGWATSVSSTVQFLLSCGHVELSNFRLEVKIILI